ncbi:hypothetical protein RFI_23013 [Reticulomyxa filosa]|uniref:Coatomer subunit zeta n=1 Tax=Reticulomyxa filosa TaxID=46433 RepID=X6MK16_RETFI|nr:hypothetical protein RFI_23013 [Reticulomyxa filosa]|eukprot:ETO14353.1 hypothetical protein RFI_23013 [Reticulomyxa filosa]
MKTINDAINTKKTYKYKIRTTICRIGSSSRSNSDSRRKRKPFVRKILLQTGRFEGKESQTKFETGILNKINRSQAKNETDVMLYNDHLVLFKSFQTVRLLLIASPTANELIMDEVLKGLEDALNALLR